jgi:hypothetical protein
MWKTYVNKTIKTWSENLKTIEDVKIAYAYEQAELVLW